MAEKEAPKRGLPAIHEAREMRAQRGGSSGLGGKFWVWCGIAIVAVCVFYWKKTATENEAYRNRILTKQRAIDAAIGPTYFPLRQTVEGFTMEVAKADLAKDKMSVVGDPVTELLTKPGVYLRLTAPDAASPEKIRAASVDSLRDAFTACFSKAKNPDPHDGKECRSTKECDGGKLCNEVGRCTVLSQPANLRVAYRGMRVLSEQWVRDVQTADDQLRLRLYESDLDDANASDIPAAIELMKRAQYFLVVIDEVPPGTVVPEGATLAEVVQADVHPTRVGLIDLRTNTTLLEARRVIDVNVPMVPGAADAQRRQVLNCQLAMDVKATLHAD